MDENVVDTVEEDPAVETAAAAVEEVVVVVVAARILPAVSSWNRKRGSGHSMEGDSEICGDGGQAILGATARSDRHPQLILTAVVSEVRCYKALAPDACARPTQ